MTVREHPAVDHEALLGDRVQLIDVREPVEVAGGTLPGFVNIPLGELPTRLAELDPGRRVVLLCRSGNRSGQAAAWLARQGFVDVVNLAGGITAVERAARVAG
ncbi:MAG: rhodanese-like domain-containing protein [Acidimicrobiia bacterium]